MGFGEFLGKDFREDFGWILGILEDDFHVSSGGFWVVLG